MASTQCPPLSQREDRQLGAPRGGQVLLLPKGTREDFLEEGGWSWFLGDEQGSLGGKGKRPSRQGRKQQQAKAWVQNGAGAQWVRRRKELGCLGHHEDFGGNKNFLEAGTGGRDQAIQGLNLRLRHWGATGGCE